MKKKFAVILSAIMALNLTLPVLGAEKQAGGTVHIDPIANLALTQEQLNAGYEVNVTGYVEFDNRVPDKDGGLVFSNQGRLDILTLEVQKDGGAFESIQKIDNDPPLDAMDLASRGKFGREFGFTAPWKITEVGSYLLKVTATFTGPYEAASDVEDVTVELLIPIIVDYPAAPAVAAAILKNAGIPHRYQISGKTYGNYISDVAAHMGSTENDENGSWFDGIDKSDVDAYYEAVYDYLKSIGANLP
ncbi:hypothetical protein [Youngiibacter fragilis]|uniref:Uncharacterized protein n=1 Tax=Youngiibacter fragilis 232.1 TaxID=994573 RepID=V7I3N2_9CLOT|nr:hypothetical protein [Youngiibacter fragilis]ETA80865.1 hypothetical protein T472_0209845 [Youngiibacter fragilis 232.1]